MRGSDSSLSVQRAPTGVLSIDWRLGGGFARGRTIEMFGPPAAGKTTLALYAMAAAQKRGEQVAFVDTEGTWDPVFSEHLGVDVDAVTYHRQRHGHQVVGLIELLLRSGSYGVIVLDSIAALLPRQELERDIEDSSMGTQQAKLMSEALRRLTAANGGETVMIYINQLRDTLSVFGKRNITSGGKAMSFYATTRLELAYTEQIKAARDVVDPEKGTVRKQAVVGHRTMVKVEKEKSGGCHRGDLTSFVFDYESGMIDTPEDLIFVGLQLGAVSKKGNTWTMGSKQFRQRARLHRFLKENPEYAVRLESHLRKRISAPVVGQEAAPEVPEPPKSGKRTQKSRRGGGKGSAG